MLPSVIWDKNRLEALNIVLCNEFQVRQIGQFFCHFYGKPGIWGNFELAVRELPLCVFSSSIPACPMGTTVVVLWVYLTLERSLFSALGS